MVKEKSHNEVPYDPILQHNLDHCKAEYSVLGTKTNLRLIAFLRIFISYYV